MPDSAGAVGGGRHRSLRRTARSHAQVARSPLRIAVIGPFAIENYGDHVIRVVLERMLSEYLPLASADIFDAVEGRLGFGGEQAVFSIESLEERHVAQPYDAIVIAGGSVIHFEVLMQEVNGARSPYPLWKLWAESSRVAAKHGVKLIWNSPEVPIDFSGWEVFAARALIGSVDYLAVRDGDSVRALAQIGGERAFETPDSGWLVRRVFGDDAASVGMPGDLIELALHQNVAVFHCNQRLPRSDFEQVTRVLESIQGRGYRVVLVPLAYANGEQRLLRELNDSSGDAFLISEDHLSLAQMVGLFARCDLYVGLSLHGAITTVAYGGEVVAFDYERRRKTRNLYTSLGKARHYTTNLDDLERVIAGLGGPTRRKQVSRRVGAAAAQVDESFARMAALLATPDDKEPRLIDVYYQLALTETQARFGLQQQLRDLSEGYRDCYEQYLSLRRAVLGDDAD